MNVVERILAICKEKHIPISRLERDCGFSNAYFAGLKKGDLPTDRLQIVSDYLGISVEYLMTGKQENYYIDKETREIAEEIRKETTSFRPKSNLCVPQSFISFLSHCPDS